MTETPLVRGDDTPERPIPRRSWLPIAIVALALALLAGGAAWWYLSRSQAIPDWERVPVLDLAAPAGDAFLDDTPWASLQVSPARPGEENALRVKITPRTQQGTPIPATDSRIVALTAQPLSVVSTAPESLELQADPNDGDVLMATSSLDEAGWWRFRAEVDGVAEASEFHLLIPDPNINGPAAVPTSGSSPEGEALFQRGMEAITTLRDVRFTQWIADGKGNSALSEHAVTAGGDGAPPGFTYRAAGGMEAINIGSTRWINLPGDLDWQKQEGATVVLPSEWDEEYFGATGFTIIGEETIDGEPCQLLAFVVPELSEPRRQTVAWYLWWVDQETGHVRQETMVSRLHYMLNRFSDFDVPFALAPPEARATPVASGTPVS